MRSTSDQRNEDSDPTRREARIALKRVLHLARIRMCTAGLYKDWRLKKLEGPQACAGSHVRCKAACASVNGADASRPTTVANAGQAHFARLILHSTADPGSAKGVLRIEPCQAAGTNTTKDAYGSNST